MHTLSIDLINDRVADLKDMKADLKMLEINAIRYDSYIRSKLLSRHEELKERFIKLKKEIEKSLGYKLII